VLCINGDESPDENSVIETCSICAICVCLAVVKANASAFIRPHKL
jgi:hypothetical protein